MAADLFSGTQSSQCAHKGGLGLRHIHGSDRGAESGFGALGRLARTFHINFMRHLGRFGHHDDVIVLHFDKSAGYGKDLCVISRAHANFARLKLRDERQMILQNPKFAVCCRDNNRFRLSLEHSAFGGQDINSNRHIILVGADLVSAHKQSLCLGGHKTRPYI